MLKGIVCAGFGGQGVLTAGKLLLYAAYKQGRKVTWFPSYGNEMRGGSANCNVVISDERIASPYVDHPDILIALNGPSLDRFQETMKAGGALFVNTSLIDKDKITRSDVEVFCAPVTDIAISLKNERSANIVMLGYFCKKAGIFTGEEFSASMCEYFETSGKGKYNEKNIETFMAGYNLE
ncbi:2-oxoacid:acceptor oxidoreductase family protein [Bacilliculturomica massiliensis]|uniref:2-oxoacid:acceptor oxidoreductase family protein n=1 Tax=Bacilliculturomica massiliensis TaxID=1917867 RepID=UPI001031FC3F|nr:2-oxoacid:acceptor oxidoreductase family protein [Bacilliculturomica massiliensis]